MKKIITVSREFGAGGGEIGKKVAKELGFEYFDKELIVRAAREANVDIERMLALDENVPVLFGFTQSLFDMYNAPLDERLFHAQKNIIKKIAEHGHCVIVGRNANSILSEFDDAVHVFVNADPYWRARRLQQGKLPDKSEQQILNYMKTVDKRRTKYCSYYTNTEFGQSQYYDICLNSSKLGIEQCVQIICGIARS